MKWNGAEGWEWWVAAVQSTPQVRGDHFWFTFKVDVSFRFEQQNCQEKRVMRVKSATHHLSALLLFVRVLQLSVHYPAGQNKKSNTCEVDHIRSLQVQTPALLLRVRGLPDASQFVRLHGSVAGELQQPLDVVEDGRLVVGQRELHLPGRSQPRHLNAHEQLLQILKEPSVWRSLKIKGVNFQTDKFSGLVVTVCVGGCGRLTFRVSERWGDGAHSTSSWTSERGVPDRRKRIFS